MTDIQQNGSPSVKVLFTVDDLQNKSPQEKAAMDSKLHKQFGHPVNSERLKQFLRDDNIWDDDLFKQIETVMEFCDICERYKMARSHPVVSLQPADDFNQCLAMDLKFITTDKRLFIILHIIDVFTHFSQDLIIFSKHKETTANAILKYWVSIFGVPQSIFGVPQSIFGVPQSIFGVLWRVSLYGQSVLKMPFTITWATALISLCLGKIQIYPQCSLQSHQHSMPQQQVS